MKRSWIGFALLLVLLILSLLVTWLMGTLHSPTAQLLVQAADAVLLGSWEDAAGCFDRAQAQWHKWEHLRSCFADHSPAEEIDAGFAELQVYFAARENAAFAAASRELARKIDAVGEAHALVWWNLL